MKTTRKRYSAKFNPEEVSARARGRSQHLISVEKPTSIFLLFAYSTTMTNPHLNHAPQSCRLQSPKALPI